MYPKLIHYNKLDKGGHFRVTQIVGDTKGIHAMIPGKLFLKAGEPFWFAETKR